MNEVTPMVIVEPDVCDDVLSIIVRIYVTSTHEGENIAIGKSCGVNYRVGIFYLTVKYGSSWFAPRRKRNGWRHRG